MSLKNAMDPEADLLFGPQLERTISDASHCCRGLGYSRTSVLEVRGKQATSEKQSRGARSGRMQMC
jgi:hypothetical protein